MKMVLNPSPSSPVLLESGMILEVASGGLIGERYIITGFDPQFREDILEKNGDVKTEVPDRPVATAWRMIDGKPGDKPIKLPFPNAVDGFEFDEMIILPYIERTKEEKDDARRARWAEAKECITIYTLLCNKS